MRNARLLLAIAAMLISTACSGTRKDSADNTHNQSSQQATDSAAKGKTLVAFFSHAGDNYSVGNVKVGNTKIVADCISEITGAAQFEIKTSKYDGMAYKPLCDLAKEEQSKGELPPYEGKIDDIDDYDTVFIGGPVWWGTWPQVMFTFFADYDLNGKKLIPFTTHEGSRLGQCISDLKKAYPNANISGEFAIYGHEVRDGKEKVKEWLKEIGF